jgi:peptide/nickel transport system ATP-binding protein
VDLKIYENEIYGIAGESGCGKTTLLKALYNDIVPPLRLIEGKVYYRVNWEEVDVTRIGREEKRKLRMEYISYIPQGSMSVLNPVLKLKDTYEDFIGSHVSGRAVKKSSNLPASRSRHWVYQRISPMSTHQLSWNAPRDHRPGITETAHHD